MRFVTIPCLLLLACSGDKNLDSGGDDTGSEEIGPCGRYSSAWRTNADWQWAVTPQGVTTQGREGSWEVLAMGEEEYAGVKVFMVQESAEFSSHTWPEDEIRLTWRYSCGDDGVRLVLLEGAWERSNDGISLHEAGWWAIDLPDHPLVLPNDLEVGQTWSFDSAMLYSASGTTKAVMALSGSYEVLAEEEVTVPAGTFQAMKVVSTWSGDPRSRFAPTTETRFIAPDVGDVSIEGYAELQSWESDPEFTY